MASFTSHDKMVIERLFGMRSGYVLDFTNRTFQELILEVTGIDIYHDKYAVQGDSKANRLRSFWKAGSDYLNGVLLHAFLDRLETNCLLDGRTIDATEGKMVEECRKIADRLKVAVAEEDLAAIRPIGAQREFDVLARAIRDAIGNNEPEAALDRLHTYAMKYVRSRCSARGIPVDRDKPLHSLFGEYLKTLKASGVVLTTMTDRILKSSVSVLEAFNDIRNDRTLAHDNPLLGSKESMFIFKAVSNLVRFLDEVDPMDTGTANVQSTAG